MRLTKPFPALLFSLAFWVLGFSAARGQVHTRTIYARPTAVFSFDPVTNRPTAASVQALAAYADRWRTELGPGNITVVCLTRPEELGIGWHIYHTLADSMLLQHAMAEVGAVSPLPAVLSAEMAGGLPLDSVRGEQILVADSYRIGSEVASQRKFDKLYMTSRDFLPELAAEAFKVRAFFAQPIATLARSLSTRGCYFGPSAFSTLFHTFQRQATGAQLSLFAPPQFDATLDSGAVRIADVLRLFTHENALVTVRLTGAELDGFLEQIYGMSYFTIAGTQSDLVRTRVPYFLHDDLAGARYRVDLSQRSGRRVTIYYVGDGAFSEKTAYTLALSSFRAADLKRKYPHLVVRMVEPDYRLALIRWLMARGPESPLNPVAPDNYSLAPERWVSVIAARERRAIFE